MVLVQKFPFFQFFFRQYSSENDFYDILERKNFFLSYKDKKFITSKNWYFSNWVNPWFWSKSSHFSNFFFYEIYAKKMFFTILSYEKTPL